MDFRLTEDQTTLAQGVRDFLSGVHGPERLRALDGDPTRRSPDLWRELVAIGLPGLLAPEADGGMGLGLVEAVLIAQELGRAGVAEPIVDTALVAVPWLVAKGDATLLGGIAAGDVKVALAHPVNPWIADLGSATHLIRDGGISPTKPGTEVALESVDPLRRLVAVDDAREADALLLDLAAAMSAAQLIGIADAMLAMAVDYASIRQQFGQPIGAFQAIKHHLATVAVRIEFARPVVLRAAVALHTDAASAAIAVSHAKLAAGDAAMAAAETAIHVHGAMGYTYEVDLHFWMKRAWALAGAWGDRAYHLARIDAGVIGGSLPIGPFHTFAVRIS